MRFFGMCQAGFAVLRRKSPDRQGMLPSIAVAILALAMPSSMAAETIPEPVALLQGLDKITARVSKFEAPVGAAFLEIDEVRPGEVNLRVFSGWMFASSPALSALEHPVYDINVLDCRTESGSPPSQSGKVEEKTAR